MKAQLVTTPEHQFTPTTDTERTVFRRAIATHELATIEMRAPGGGFVKEEPADLNTPFSYLDLVQMRFQTPDQLRALAMLFNQMANRMDALALARIQMGRGTEYVVNGNGADTH